MHIFGWGAKEPFMVNNKPAPNLGLMLELTKELRNFNALPQGTLRWMKNTCDYYGLSPEHAFYQKIMLGLSKCQNIAKRVFQSDIEYTAVDAPHQGFETLNAIKERIKKEGAAYKSLSLNNVDDELIQLIVMSCPNLVELRIRPRADCLIAGLTDSGLKLIPQIKKLTHLELNVWNTVSMTSAGLSSILMDSGFQSRVLGLKLIAPGVEDSLLPLISKCAKLEILTLQSCCLTAAGLSGLTWPSGLRELNLNQSTSMSIVAFNNAVLLKIAKCKALTTLVIGGDNQITEEGVIALLEAIPTLKHLTWNNFPFSLKVMSHLPERLQSLSIGDLTGLFYINGLQNYLKRATALTSLTILNSDFGSEDIEGYLPSTLTHLNLGTSGLSSLKFIPPSIVSLTIQGSTQITPSQFSELSRLSLTTLRLVNCPTLNDEAFKQLMQGKLIETLQSFEVYNASISHESIPLLTQIPKLHTLMIGQCYGLGLRGMEHLLKSPNLRDRITRLYLDGPILHEDMRDLFNYFTNLKVFFIGNIMEYPNTQEALNKLVDVRPLKAKNGVALWWYGEPMIQEFSQAL